MNEFIAENEKIFDGERIMKNYSKTKYTRIVDMKPRLQKNLIKQVCLNCQKEISKNRKFCSLSCGTIYNNKCGKIGMKDKKHSEATKQKMSDSSNQYGSRNPMWKGGVTLLRRRIRNLSEMKEWRLQVFGRDNFTCQKCDKRGCYLESHHIKSFSVICDENNFKTIKDALECEELWKIENGKTLCRECHNKTKDGGWNGKR